MSKAEPTKAKANKSKPLIVYRVSVKINLFKNISCCKKMKYFPSFVCLLHGDRERAAIIIKINKNNNNNNNNLLIDRIVCKDAQRGHRNLSMAWIDVSNAYDSVDHRWLVEMFKLHRFPEWFGFLIGKLYLNEWHVVSISRGHRVYSATYIFNNYSTRARWL